MGARINYGSGAAWENRVGYSRVARVDRHLYIAGTMATGAGGSIAGGADPHLQTRQVLANIAAALERAGASLDGVVRTRSYGTDITPWEAIGRAHGEVFGNIRPVTAMVEVARLIEAAMLVEIEADAYTADRPVAA